MLSFNFITRLFSSRSISCILSHHALLRLVLHLRQRKNRSTYSFTLVLQNSSGYHDPKLVEKCHLLNQSELSASKLLD